MDGDVGESSRFFLPAPSQTSTLPADQGSAVIDATGHPVIGAIGHPVIDAAVHPANLAADIALAMSAAPFTGRHFSHW